MKFKHLVFESPQMVMPTDFDLNDTKSNNKKAKYLLSNIKEILEETKDYIFIRTGNNKSGYFVIISKHDEMIKFYLIFRSKDLGLLGNSVTQIALWRSFPFPTYYLNDKSITKTVFFDILLKRWDTVISDTRHTESGKRFWGVVMGEAIQKGYAVGLYNSKDISNTLQFFDDNINKFDSWIHKNYRWGDSEEHKDWVYIITKRKEDFTNFFGKLKK